MEKSLCFVRTEREKSHACMNTIQWNESELVPNLNEVGNYASRPCMKFLNSLCEEQQSEILKKYSKQCIPKRYLKKCKNCCFKKRSCFISPLSCNALSRLCYSCNEPGHFSKSVKCKEKRLKSQNKTSNEICVSDMKIHKEFVFSDYCDDTDFSEFSEVSSDESMILQCDGGNDLKDSSLVKRVYAVNCEIEEISTILNFVRSLDFIWIISSSHELCDFNSKHKELNCYFCHLRSSCLRLGAERKKGPKSIKVYEFVYQLWQYEKLSWDWSTQKKRHSKLHLKFIEIIEKSRRLYFICFCSFAWQL